MNKRNIYAVCGALAVLAMFVMGWLTAMLDMPWLLLVYIGLLPGGFFLGHIIGEAAYG